jgi:hypothetical protein
MAFTEDEAAYLKSQPPARRPGRAHRGALLLIDYQPSQLAGGPLNGS